MCEEQQLLGYTVISIILEKYSANIDLTFWFVSWEQNSHFSPKTICQGCKEVADQDPCTSKQRKKNQKTLTNKAMQTFPPPSLPVLSFCLDLFSDLSLSNFWAAQSLGQKSKTEKSMRGFFPTKKRRRSLSGEENAGNVLLSFPWGEEMFNQGEMFKKCGKAPWD